MSNYKDEDILKTLLASLKALKGELNIFTQEASSPQILKPIEAAYTSVSKLQRQTFQTALDKGWYMLEYDTTANIKKLYKKLSSSKQAFES